MTTTKQLAGSPIHYVKRLDSGYKFQDHLRVDSESVDLLGADVTILVRAKQTGALLVESSATILQTGDDQDVAEPNVEWQPGAADLDYVGMVEVEWRVILSSGRRCTFPRRGAHLVMVEDTLDRPGTSSSSSASD